MKKESSSTRTSQYLYGTMDVDSTTKRQNVRLMKEDLS